MVTRQSKEYKEWRLYALNRDGFKCKICGHAKFLHVHHIYPWKKYKKLRVDNSNSITLCRECHKQLRFRELSFVSMLQKLINNQQLNKTEQTLFNMILKNKKVRLYGGTIKKARKVEGSKEASTSKKTGRSKKIQTGSSNKTTKVLQNKQRYRKI